MPSPFYIDDFEDKIDSLYRLVIISSRRANQIIKNQSHGFGAVTQSVKPTVTALEEVLEDKISYFDGDLEDEVLSE